MSNAHPGGNANVQLHELGPSPDVFEYTLSTADVPLTELGGACRDIHVISGATSSTLLVQTIGSNGTDRTLTHLANGDKLQTGQYTLIRGSSNGSTGGLILRCYK